MKTYLVGGMVRDEIMGLPSKDADFSVILDDVDMFGQTDPFSVMRDNLVQRGFKIFVESPEHYTIRAQFPKGDNAFGVRDADFVLAREEGPYSDGRRPDWVRAGTLMMDLQRRDFSFNAIAKGPNGSYIDPFNGIEDIKAGIIRAVGDPMDRLTEDALRALRALRFSVTKRFKIESELAFAMQSVSVLDSLEHKISDERIKDELNKMFRAGAVDSMVALMQFPFLMRVIFSGKVNLEATMRQKGFQ